MPFKKHKASITGVHGYVPDYVLTNSELETLVDTTDEWIKSRDKHGHGSLNERLNKTFLNECHFLNILVVINNIIQVQKDL